MKRVFCFGEVLVDFLNTGEEGSGELSLNQFTQFPGGAPANAAVAVARLGGSASFIGQVGNDQFGDFLIESLEHYGVDTSYTAVHNQAKTPLAFVFVDEHGERSFSFRRDATADILYSAEQVDSNWFEAGGVFHFCSNTLTDRSIATVTENLVSLVNQKSLLVSFDVNLRHNLWSNNKADADLVNRLVRQSHVIKYSRDEFDYMNTGDPEQYLSDLFLGNAKLVLITDGANYVEVITAEDSLKVRAPDVKAVDTTGGGDAFIGACLFGLSRLDDPFRIFEDIEKLKSIVDFAVNCGAIAVSRPGAFHALPTFEEVSDLWCQG